MTNISTAIAAKQAQLTRLQAALANLGQQGKSAQ